MTDNQGFVRVSGAATSFDAELIIGRLRAEGIDARSDGEQPVDEYSMAQQLAKQESIAILVPAGDAERAQAILETPAERTEADADQPQEAEDAEPAVDRDRNPGPPLLTIALALVSLIAIGGWVHAASQIPDTPPLEWSGDAWVEFWPGNRVMRSRYVSEDDDDHYEVYDTYNRAGRMYGRLIDRNDNGIYEEWVNLPIAQDAAWEHNYDDDEDGWADRIVVDHTPLKEVYFDRDKDGLMDRRELQDSLGRAIRVHEYTDVEMFWVEVEKK